MPDPITLRADALLAGLALAAAAADPAAKVRRPIICSCDGRALHLEGQATAIQQRAEVPIHGGDGLDQIAIRPEPWLAALKPAGDAIVSLALARTADGSGAITLTAPMGEIALPLVADCACPPPLLVPLADCPLDPLLIADAFPPAIACAETGHTVSVLAGIHLALGDAGRGTVTGTDGKHLHAAAFAHAGPALSAILPAHLAAHLVGLCTDCLDLAVGLEKNQGLGWRALLLRGGCQITVHGRGRTTEGIYPPWQKALHGVPSHQLTLDPAATLAALHLVTACLTPQQTMIILEPDPVGICLRGSGVRGSGRAAIPCSGGLPGPVGLAAGYLRQLARLVPGSFPLRWFGPGRGLITTWSASGLDHTHLIMPITITGSHERTAA